MTVPAPSSPNAPQWLFDEDGLYAPAEDYFIEADWLSERRTVNGRECYAAAIHLAETKSHWFCPNDEFWIAFGAALLNSGHTIDPVVWAATYEEAERKAAEAQVYRAERERQFLDNPMSRFTPRSMWELRAGKGSIKP